MESESEKSERLSISSDSVYDSIAYDPVKTMLSESEIEAEEPTNQKARNRTLSLVILPLLLFSLDRKRRSP